MDLFEPGTFENVFAGLVLDPVLMALSHHYLCGLGNDVELFVALDFFLGLLLLLPLEHLEGKSVVKVAFLQFIQGLSKVSSVVIFLRAEVGPCQFLHFMCLFVLPQLGLLHLDLQKELVLLALSLPFELLVFEVLYVAFMSFLEVFPSSILVLLFQHELPFETFKGILHRILDVNIF